MGGGAAERGLTHLSEHRKTTPIHVLGQVKNEFLKHYIFEFFVYSSESDT
jgi:hypothetical protein